MKINSTGKILRIMLRRERGRRTAGRKRMLGEGVKRERRKGGKRRKRRADGAEGSGGGPGGGGGRGEDLHKLWWRSRARRTQRSHNECDGEACGSDEKRARERERVGERGGGGTT